MLINLSRNAQVEDLVLGLVTYKNYFSRVELVMGKLKVSGTFLGFVEGIGRASRHPAKSCSFVFTL